MKNKIIKIGVYTYSERELAQIIRRKMMSKQFKNKKKYDRNENRKFEKISDYFFE